MMNKNILRKTQRKLTYLHTIVFGLLFLCLSLFIYYYFYNLTYSSVDKNLSSQYKTIASYVNGDNLGDKNKFLNNRMFAKGTMIYVSKDNKLLSAYPSDIIESVRPFSIIDDLEYWIHNYKYDDLDFRQLKQNLN